LCQIFRFLRPACKAVAKIIDFSGVDPEQAFPGGVFAGEAPSKQIQILFHYASPQPLEGLAATERFPGSKAQKDSAAL